MLVFPKATIGHEPAVGGSAQQPLRAISNESTEPPRVKKTDSDGSWEDF